MADELEVIDQPEIQNPPVVEFSDEQFLVELEKRTGVKPENLDFVKEKLTYQPPPPAPTDEEKTRADKVFEKRMLDKHIENGLSPEQYTTLKGIANGDLKELSLQQTKEELKAAGFNDDEISEVIKERYYQVDDSDIELEEDPAKKEALKKKKEFGSKKLQSRAEHLQKTAKSYIDSLAKEVNESDTDKKRKEQHVSNVETAFKNYQRKQTLELGKVDDTDIPPIEHEIPEEALNEAKELLKDPVKSQLLTKEGDLNLDFIIPHLVRSASYPNAVKQSYLVGGHRQVEFYESIYGPNPPNLGGSGKPKNEPGKVVRKGKSEYVAPPN